MFHNRSSNKNLVELYLCQFDLIRIHINLFLTLILPKANLHLSYLYLAELAVKVPVSLSLAVLDHLAPCCARRLLSLSVSSLCTVASSVE